jgi:hypothetical protein
MQLTRAFFEDVTKLQRHAGVYYLTISQDFSAMAATIDNLRAHWRALDLER